MNNTNKDLISRKNNLSSNNLNKIGEESCKINIINERQRTLSLRQKSINIEESNGDEKKCAKCGEVNDKFNIYLFDAEINFLLRHALIRLILIII